MIDKDFLAESSWQSSPCRPPSPLHTQTLAYMFEFGCLVHSVIIGISLGVIDKDYPQVRNVMIALCFHQLLEGIGLGAFISVANFGLLKGV